ncbi:MAG: RNA-binding protein [Cyanobacteria bacterium J06633_23]
MSVYIGNISYNITRDDLMDVFVEYGEVDRIKVPTDASTGRSKGFAFVDMASEVDEKTAINLLDGARWVGRTIRVSEAESRKSFPKRGNRRQTKRSA